METLKISWQFVAYRKKILISLGLMAIAVGLFFMVKLWFFKSPDVVPAGSTVAQLTVPDENIFPIYYTEPSEVPGFLEPEVGCMAGAFLEGEPSFLGDITGFERAVGVPHQIYGKELYLGEAFPSSFVLDCFIKEKIPLVTLYPNNREKPYDLQAVTKLAQEMGRLSLPLLLEVFPNPELLGGKEEYIQFFQESQKIINWYAPNTGIIWTVPVVAGETYAEYYPGDNAVDYVGGHVFLSGEMVEKEVTPSLEYWYYTWQGEKPLLLTQVAVSHYSGTDSKYRQEEGAQRLLELYEQSASMPRIRGVVYFAQNQMTQTPQKTAGENYLLWANERIRKGYQESLGFLQKSNFETGILKSPFFAYEFQGQLYFSLYFLQYELGVSATGNLVQVNGIWAAPLEGYDIIRGEQGVIVEQNRRSISTKEGGW